MDKEAFSKVITYLDQQLAWTPMECILNERSEEEHHRELYTCRRTLLAFVGRASLDISE